MITEPEYKLCKRGHLRSPDNVKKSGGCKECEGITSRIYNHSQRGMENRRRWNHSPKGKEWFCTYSQSPHFGKSPQRQEYKRRSVKYMVVNITKLYVSQLLDIPVALITDDLYLKKREQLLLYRALKELQQTIKELKGKSK